MVTVNKKAGNGAERHDSTSRETCVCSVADPVEHYVTGFVGLLATVLTVAMTYPWLVAVTERAQYLSSTWLVFLFAAVWLLFWFSLEMMWEWNAGRVRLI